ncbi:unnamed protein product [Prorocentrum cordatum]|uniref:EF-hand domain-containing protein n=1 Tax=Prorocentrum cordatum TaxID=2364126 RepID=A0ABN9PER8_9DINO|nr:unnamed protein product [Polarella glacialis]
MITEDAFIELLSTQKNVTVLEENGVDLFFRSHTGLRELFRIMDEDGNGALDVNEFVDCLYNLKGAATSLDSKLEHQKFRDWSVRCTSSCRPCSRSSPAALPQG